MQNDFDLVHFFWKREHLLQCVINSSAVSHLLSTRLDSPSSSVSISELPELLSDSSSQLLNTLSDVDKVSGIYCSGRGGGGRAARFFSISGSEKRVRL